MSLSVDDLTIPARLLGNKSQAWAQVKRMTKANAVAQREAYKARSKYRQARSVEPVRTRKRGRTRAKRLLAKVATLAMAQL